MTRLEDLQRGAQVRGLLPQQIVTLIDVQQHGSTAVEVIFRRSDGQLGSQLVYRHDEPLLEIVTGERRWSFNANGDLLRLVSEAYRIHLAHLFDPLLAVHTSLIDPLPHQTTAVYEEMLTRQPLRYLLADDPGAWNPQADKRPTVWEAAHHLIERLNSHGEAGSALLMTAMPPEMAAGARTLAYRLYNICERKGWADHARDYNALVMSWAEIGEQAAQVREARAAGNAAEQIGLGGEFNS